MQESKWFKEGVAAKESGLVKTTNPYGDKSAKWYLWNEGFDSVQDPV